MISHTRSPDESLAQRLDPKADHFPQESYTPVSIRQSFTTTITLQ